MRLFSANCHLIEPPHVFEGRLPRKWQDRAPRLLADDGNGQRWVFEQQERPLNLLAAVSGLPQSEWRARGATYAEIRPGCYDPVARLKDMDLDGVDVAVCYSSPVGIGFNGDLFAYTDEPELAAASVRAWNDWYHEEWIASAPDRFVAVGCTSYLDARAGAAEVRRNAARGFKGVVFRDPADLGLSWLGSPEWDPFYAACAETCTILVHHTELSRWRPRRDRPQQTPYPYGMQSVPFQSNAMDFLNAWLWGGAWARFPALKLLISESGGTWLPHFVGRVEWMLRHSMLHREGWPDSDLTPLEAIRRSVVFSTQEVDTARTLAVDLGVGGWMLEDDFPHAESVWPETAAFYARALAGLAEDDAERLAWRNASDLFRHPLP